MKRVRRIAPRAPQIAPRQTHKNARQPRARAFSLNRFEYFRDEHELAACGFGRAVREGTRLFPRRSNPDLLLKPGILFSPGFARQPVQRPKKKRHRNNQPWIAGRKTHLAQHDCISRRHQQRWDQYDE